MKAWKRVLPRALVMGTLPLLCACTTIVNAPEGAAPGVRVRDARAPQARIRMNTVAILDKSLQTWEQRDVKHEPAWLSIFCNGVPQNTQWSKITVQATNARRTPTGTVEVWATLRNRTDYPLTIDGRTQFFSRDDSPLEGPSAWQRVHLPPQSVATYKELSTNVTEVGYYYIEIREGR
jgi:hypothetical protein